MKEVSFDEFCEFLKDKQYTKDIGLYINSEYYIEKDTGEKIAYHEFISYGVPEIFRIKAIT